MKLLQRILLTLMFSLPIWAQTPDKPLRSVTDPGVVTTRQNITPAGVQTVFDGRVYGLAFGASTNEIYALTARGRVNQTNFIKLDWKANSVLQRVTLKENPGLQGLLFDAAGRQVLVSAAFPEKEGSNPKGSQASPVVNPDGTETFIELTGGARLLAVNESGARSIIEGLGHFITGAPAVAQKPNARGQRLAVLPLIYNDQLAVVDLNSGKLVGRPNVGIAPFGAAISADGTVAFVTNWGGRLPTTGDLTAPTGYWPNADQVVVDERGIASTGTVTRIDLTTMKVTHTISVELHPTAIVWDEKNNRLYVANSNKDSISVIDTTANKVIQTRTLSSQETRGFAPTALALSPDGKTLFAACGGLNAVAVLETRTMSVAGYIPTGWYPNALALSPDGKHLAIATLLGPGSGWREAPNKRYVHSYRGSVSLVPIPDQAQLNSYTAAVWENNHLAKPAATAVRPAVKPAPVAIPARAGDPSLIEHVVYIIKENRTYDQVLGDMAKGNGDKSLVMFGEDVTPNQHRLADQFVLLDNFYASGGNSAQGHQWLTQANEVSYCLWPGYAGRSYPYDGSDPIAYSDGGFIWDAALKMKKSVRIFGEFAGNMGAVPGISRVKLFERWKAGEDFSREWNVTAPIKPVNNILAKNFPSYSTNIPDVVRARIFAKEVKQWEAEGKMPNLVLLQLPSNHTNGTNPGRHTPKAMVADNDLALGQIVEALSKSPFWKKMAIFVVEDDAQNGVDHVDGHRTVALAISPYTRRGHVDSTFYAQQSILKTIELILGLPTLSLFDLIANDMRASFTNTADFTTYESVEPKQSLFEMNPPLTSLKGQARLDAVASMKMRFDVPDAAPTETLNRIVWRQVKGQKIPYPRVKRSLFAPMAVELDDDDR
ncbi:MAG: beta-propeller fold lactonase family protein [Acidobacteria bacterium]|nr:beta-propeller fold lactonase family protein [Acidobacteriota bacterium]